jgi:hypothetical protein
MNIFSKLNPFAAKPTTAAQQNGITIDRLMSIEGYVPNPVEKKYHIVKTDDVAIFKAFDAKKPKTAARALYAVGKVAAVTPETKAFVAQYGEKVILVSKRFLKLRKKTQLLLIEKVGFEMANVPDKFMPGMNEISSTNLDRRLAAELLMMEKYGYRKVKNLLKKEQTANLSLMKNAGKVLYKLAKKQAKLSKNVAPVATTVNPEVLMGPVTFNNVAPAAN